jgi:hypothetical protein
VRWLAGAADCPELEVAAFNIDGHLIATGCGATSETALDALLARLRELGCAEGEIDVVKGLAEAGSGLHADER